MSDATSAAPTNFIRQIIDADLAEGKNNGNVVTRFPPEPNGYLHIGHAKSICLNFGIARDYAGQCFMRFDDTNPSREDTEFVDSILTDVRWLGFDWDDRLTHASDYFQRLYDCAIQLIEDGKAYVCALSGEEIRRYRGTLTEPGRDSPHRDRPVEENLDLFKRMRNGEFSDGELVLRARIDMASPNISMRDPVLYRIKRATHHQTGDEWCIYPMYDFTHCLSDSFEGVTHSLCTLEFEDNRALYDWVLDSLGHAPRPYQYEFSRLNLDYTVTSKRRLTELVETKTGEEDETCAFRTEGALFEYVTDAEKGARWVDRGRGDLHLNEGENGSRIVMRAKGNYRLMLNAALFKGQKFQLMEGGKGVSFSCKNVAAGADAKMSTFALKMRAAASNAQSQAEGFHNAATKAIAKLSEEA